MTQPFDVAMREGLARYFDGHEYPDTDNGAESIHHTLGPKATQAAAGNHEHTFPVLKAFRNNARTINGAGTWVPVGMDASSFYSPKVYAVDPTLQSGGGYGVTVKREGFYLALLQVEWQTNNVGLRKIRATVNGTAQNEIAENATAGANHTNTVLYLLQLSPADIIIMEATQTSGGGLSLILGPNKTVILLVYLGETPVDFNVSGLWAP